MAKTLTTVGGGVLASKLNFRLCYNFSLNSKKTKRKGFSVAEAMIALLIGSLALGMAAPMITKQIKSQNTVDVERRLMNNRIDNILPVGAVMYFDLAACPDGWEPLTVTRPNAKGAFIRNVGEVNPVGTYQQNAAPNITGTMENFVGGSYYSISGAANKNQLSMSGAFSNEYLPVGGDVFHAYYQGGYLEKMNIHFDASEGGATSYGRDNTAEVRPDNITLLACKRIS